MWFVSWDAIYDKSTPSKALFSPLFSLLLQKVTSTTAEPILFLSQHASFLSLWSILLFFVNYSSTSSLIWLRFLLRFSLNVSLFNRIPLEVEISFNWGPHFAGMFFSPYKQPHQTCFQWNFSPPFCRRCVALILGNVNQ